MSKKKATSVVSNLIEQELDTLKSLKKRSKNANNPSDLRRTIEDLLTQKEYKELHAEFSEY